MRVWGVLRAEVSEIGDQSLRFAVSEAMLSTGERVYSRSASTAAIVSSCLPPPTIATHPSRLCSPRSVVSEPLITIMHSGSQRGTASSSGLRGSGDRWKYPGSCNTAQNPVSERPNHFITRFESENEQRKV